MPHHRSRPRRRAQVFLFDLPIILTILTVMCGPGWSQSNNPGGETPVLVPPTEATGASRCVVCHSSEVEGYSRSAMAHSLRRPGKEPDGIVEANGSKITMHSSPRASWQRWENSGETVEYHVDYVIGSGNHASGYLVDLGGYLFQSPVAYYKSRNAYDLAPGFEKQPDPDFTRPISPECVLCHSGSALHVPGTRNQYRSPVFLEEAITCERCHGPSEKHLANPVPGTIINPAKLKPAARASICEQCHLFGVERVPNPGKSLSDFVPGQRLEDTFTTYQNANPTGALKVISQVEQLALSACARNSEGRLWCGTCHDPHDKPLQPVEYYRAKCLSCHSANFPASHPADNSNCLECHMPRRTVADGGHTAFTDHRIQRRPESQPDAPPDSSIVAWREPPLNLQKRNLGIVDIEVGLQRHSPAMIGEGYRNLTEVQQQFANDSEFFKWIGEALFAAKQTSEAKIAFERALQLSPDSAIAETSVAAAYLQGGDTDAAIPHLQRALDLDPLDLPTASTLVALYKKEGRAAESLALSSRIKTAMSQQAEMPEPAAASLNNDGKSADAVFKNIQVLKSVPAGRLIPTMKFISSSLGVECSFCHVEGHFEKDEKKPKLVARDMMKMMFTLNKNNFADHREVTCYSCHRGALKPVATPEVGTDMRSQSGDDPGTQSTDNLPTVNQIVGNYIQSLGGSAAIEKITSRVEQARSQFRGQNVGIEVFTEQPGKQTIIRHLPTGEGMSVFDVNQGWMMVPNQPPREMHDADLAAARMDADLQFALHIRQMFPDLRIQYSEKVNGRDTYVLLGTQAGQPSTRFYFDQQSGFLVRIVRYADSPLGLNPSQLDYTDYRAVDGIEVPFRLTVSEPGSSQTIQVEKVQQNVAIDDSRFVKPMQR
jgi:photosynthetic reaction center cytochrome c subunit